MKTKTLLKVIPALLFSTLGWSMQPDIPAVESGNPMQWKTMILRADCTTNKSALPKITFSVSYSGESFTPHAAAIVSDDLGKCSTNEIENIIKPAGENSDFVLSAGSSWGCRAKKIRALLTYNKITETPIQVGLNVDDQSYTCVNR